MAALQTANAVRVGDHACARLGRTEDRCNIAAAFVRDGVRRGLKVVVVDGDQLSALVRGMAGAEPAIRDALAGAGIEVRSSRETYLTDGRFEPDAMLQTVRDERQAALAAGYAGVAITGEMCWALGAVPGRERLVEYERRLSDEVKRGDIALLCQYDQTRFPSGLLTDVCAEHDVKISPDLAALDNGGPLAAARMEDGTLRLAGELDYDMVEPVAGLLRGWFHGPVRLDLTDLEYADVAGMRALRGRQPRPLTVLGASPAVRRLLALLAWDTDPDVRIAGAS